MILTYSEPFNRPGRLSRVNSDDVAEALKFFGSGVKVIMVNPAIISTVEGVIPEDIELLPHPGCASWEIYGEISDKPSLPVQKPDVAKIIDTPAVPEIPNNYATSPVIQPVEYQRHPVGRPPKSGAVCRTTEWRRKKKIQGVLL